LIAKHHFGTPSEFIRNLIRQDKEQRLSRLQVVLLDALQTGELGVAQEELNGRGPVEALPEKLNSK
jgi:antitoxin ParD1/3/4